MANKIHDYFSRQLEHACAGVQEIFRSHLQDL